MPPKKKTEKDKPKAKPATKPKPKPKKKEAESAPAPAPYDFNRPFGIRTEIRYFADGYYPPQNLTRNGTFEMPVMFPRGSGSFFAGAPPPPPSFVPPPAPIAPTFIPPEPEPDVEPEPEPDVEPEPTFNVTEFLKEAKKLKLPKEAEFQPERQRERSFPVMYEPPSYVWEQEDTFAPKPRKKQFEPSPEPETIPLPPREWFETEPLVPPPPPPKFLRPTETTNDWFNLFPSTPEPAPEPTMVPTVVSAKMGVTELRNEIMGIGEQLYLQENPDTDISFKNNAKARTEFYKEIFGDDYIVKNPEGIRKYPKASLIKARQYLRDEYNL